MGNEELTYPLIYVTGSHGKGSTVKKIAGALTRAGKSNILYCYKGYVTGAYTKPYPTLEERYIVNGIKVRLKELIKIYNTIYLFQNLISCNSNRVNIFQ